METSGCAVGVLVLLLIFKGGAISVGAPVVVSDVLCRENRVVVLESRRLEPGDAVRRAAAASLFVKTVNLVNTKGARAHRWEAAGEGRARTPPTPATLP